MSAKLTLAAVAASAVAATAIGPATPPPPAQPASSGHAPAEAAANPNGGNSATLPVSDCRARFAEIGEPLHRGEDATARQVLVCRSGYFLSANLATRDPDWVMERLTAKEIVGKGKRSSAFFADTALPAADQVTQDDYTNTGFDRGHQAPAGDAVFDQGVEDQTFNMSNMGPQQGIGFNRGAWKYLEETVRGWVLCGGRSEVYVMTGPIYDPKLSRPLLVKEATVVKGKAYIQVPIAYYKIVYDVGSKHAVGFILLNQQIGAVLKDLQAYVKPIAEIEAQTGLNFFPALDLRTQNQLESSKGVAWGHVASCKGVADG